MHGPPDQVSDHVCPVAKDIQQAGLALPLLVLATCNAQLDALYTEFVLWHADVLYDQMDTLNTEC